MKTLARRCARLALAAGCAIGLAVPAAKAGQKEDLLLEVHRQQSAAEQKVCTSLKKTVAEGTDVVLAVRTAIELGFAPCNVIRCAVEGGFDLAKTLRGAAVAGVWIDVISRCAADAGADPKMVAAIFADEGFEPDFCYFTFAPASSHDPLPPSVDVQKGGSGRPPQLSPYLP
jgi:hypothetical protein